jgi:hypothetical protein
MVPTVNTNATMDLTTAMNTFVRKGVVFTNSVAPQRKECNSVIDALPKVASTGKDDPATCNRFSGALSFGKRGRAVAGACAGRHTILRVALL